MIFKNSAILLALGATAVNGLYSNNTVSADHATTTISPDYSVKPIEKVATYSDDTTTFHVTNTVYETYWNTQYTSVSSIVTDNKSVTIAAATNPTNSIVANSQIISSMPLYSNVTALKTDSTTSTTTSTLLTTVTSAYSNNTRGCVPMTQFVTVTVTPEVKYVTVTEDAMTSFVTVTAKSSSGAFWSNSTTSN